MKQAFRVLQIAFTYIGTVVGAGFATGQEILQFFTQYGKWATITIGLSTMLFVWLGTKMMLIAHDTGSRSYEDLNKHLFGQKAGNWITWVTLLILIGVNSVMLAGAGSVFVEHLGLHYQTGLIVTLIGTYLLLGRGIQAILQMNSIVVPMMLLLSLLMITSTIHHPGANRFITLTTDSNPIQVWLSPLLYTSFNLALAQAVLVPVGNQIRSRKVLKWGGVLGGIGVGFMLMAAHFAMSAQMPGITQFEIPMGSIAFQLGWVVQSIYVSLIFMEIFSTFVADIYGMTLQLRQHVRVHPKLIILAIMLLCYSLSQFGFSSLLSILYPIFGSLALFWGTKLVMDRWGSFRGRKKHL
ncbi:MULTISPECIES: YkvI family membrane protein [unclassified Paenibacillus]|uniref:YkvI family membrane protein n=1 Tax=unclassified Paenibacillus TaxID=185978 RepID=UPI0004008D56|nr:MULTISPECIES: membrane protein [unclassified Paenibacillus]KGP82322.1 membrane protein [Paenibacillus sp. MAEPY1]KGP84413.1 membrane protein [Paenibacillus sp. MAEPY2]